MDLGDVKDVVGIIDRTMGSHSFNGQVEEEPNKKLRMKGLPGGLRKAQREKRPQRCIPVQKE